MAIDYSLAIFFDLVDEPKAIKACFFLAKLMLPLPLNIRTFVLYLTIQCEVPKF